jgi:hypothetical protein
MSSRQRRPYSGPTIAAHSRSRGAPPVTPAATTSSEPPELEEPGLIVRADPQRTRVEGLTKEHDRLLREIAKKRAQLEAAEGLSRELFATLLSRTMPLRERLRQALQDIQRLFAKLLGPSSKLSRRDKAKVRRVYEDLVVALDLPAIETTEAAAEDEAEVEPKQTRKPRPGSGDSKRHDFGVGGYSAPKPADATHPSLRALFKRLAIAFHPDKVQDEQTKAERTSLMKDVTKAYEAGDLARLMELERALLSRLPMGDEPGALERRAKELVAANTELRRQQRSLTAAIKELTLELPFDINLKAADAKQRAMSEVEQLVTDLEAEERRVSALRDFVRDFADGGMDIVDFLTGPRLPDEPAGVGEVAVGDDLLLDLIEDLLQGSPQSGRSRGRGRTSGGRHRA